MMGLVSDGKLQHATQRPPRDPAMLPDFFADDCQAWRVLGLSNYPEALV